MTVNVIKKITTAIADVKNMNIIVNAIKRIITINVIALNVTAISK
ncbi:hypothetical protein DET59_101372 [Rossellomorea aquimaris]|uniref:Uncharacterized protein n=1 Tax=Rossellomorea aquimaris TaxID=189382 RepID=A0A366F031_9BACI|nr:hypothetical protein DET59_101372 [Rossellomorea aquimaris]